MIHPRAASDIVEIAPGVSALAPGVLMLHRSSAIVAADVHFAYEDASGAALPAWSIDETAATLQRAVQRSGAQELILLGDAIHGSNLSDGAARRVRAALEALRTRARVTIVAGNHEGRSRGAAVLGETVEEIERDGWLLLHGDRPPRIPARCIIGHLHPSLPLEGRVRVPAFLAAKDAIALPALTPYSEGLNVYAEECLHALHAFGVASRRDLCVIAVARDRCYPFGTLSALRKIAVQHEID